MIRLAQDPPRFAPTCPTCRMFRWLAAISLVATVLVWWGSTHG
jgi:hypothetical protein